MNRIRLISTRTGALLAVGLVVACGRFAASEPVADVDPNTPVEAGTVWSQSQLNTAKAGNGGAGAAGQAGQIGGNGGIQTAGGCQGGSGGTGGAGGASAGGAGGVSAGILVRGPKPPLDGVTFGAGAVKGAKGPGGGAFNGEYDGQQGDTIVLP
jgi:hypothetical protein